MPNRILRDWTDSDRFDGDRYMGIGMARLAPEKTVFRPVLPSPFMPEPPEAEMGKMAYSEQLRHPNWQRKRLEALDAAEFRCSECYSDEDTLNVHHKRYVKGRMAWEYELDELSVLCEACHKHRHSIRDALNHLFCADDHGFSVEAVALGLLSGYLAARDVQTGRFEKEFRKARDECESEFFCGVAAAIFGVCRDRAAVAKVMSENLGSDYMKPWAEKLIKALSAAER